MFRTVEAAFSKDSFPDDLKDMQSWLQSNDCNPNALKIIVQTGAMLLVRIEFSDESLAKEFGSVFQGTMVARPIYSDA